MRPCSWCFGALAAILVAGACGCGSNLPKTVKVNGKVTLDGEPLQGASVQFMPQEASGHPAFGTTDEGGNFKLTTFSTNDGALPGQYKVIVQRQDVAEIEVPKEGPGGKPKSPMQAAMEAGRKAGKTRKKEPPKVPPKYSDPNKTILREKVPPDGPVNLELTSK